MAKSTLYILLGQILMWVCSCAPDQSEESTKGFNNALLLKTVADHMVLPGLQRLDSLAKLLEAEVTSLGNNPSKESLVAAQNTYSKLLVEYQYNNLYFFGPGETYFGSHNAAEKANEINTFPIDIVQTESYIAAGDTSFKNFRRDTRGIQAIDYLLFYPQNIDSTLKRLQHPNRLNYLKAVVRDAQRRISGCHEGWKVYREEFVFSTGNDAGSSISVLYNAMLLSYENIKNYKIGAPLGKRPGQTVEDPSLAEAYYSDLGLTLAGVNWTAIKDLWYGRQRNGTQGTGFRDYLLSVAGGEGLVNESKAQFEALDKAFAAFGSEVSLTQSIEQNKSAMEALNTELTKTTRFIKSEMAALLGLTITYSSSDGD